MATKENGNGKADTNVTLADVVRELRGMREEFVPELRGVNQRVDGLADEVKGMRTEMDAGFKVLGRRIDVGFRRNQPFAARMSKFETRLAKLERKRGPLR